MRACAMLLMMLLPLPALAGGDSRQALEWRQDGARLSLWSTEGEVQVAAARPETRFGVRSGDRILQVDGTPVHEVEHLADALRDSGAPTAHLRVQRGGRELTVPVNSSAWRQALAVPPPPAPPPPPSARR